MPVDMELEAVLRPMQYPMPPYPPKVITLANGKKMVVRQAVREDVPAILKSVHPCLFIERDYYDVVSARLYGELLAWYRHRVKSEYCLMGQVDGYLVGVVNGRLENEKVGMSYHTLAIDRGLRIGSHLFAAKMEYHMEYMKQDAVLIDEFVDERTLAGERDIEAVPVRTEMVQQARVEVGDRLGLPEAFRVDP